MQRLALLLSATVLAFSFTACSTTAPKKSCCSTDGSCKAPAKKAQ